MAAAGSALALFYVAVVATLALLPEPAALGLQALCQWDCQWYGSIALEGYVIEPKVSSLQANYGFFPGYPAAVWLVMQVTQLRFTEAGLLLNAAYLVAFSWLVLTSQRELFLRTERDALVFLAAFALAPWAIYSRVPYTEMQFNLALLATFVAWRREQYAAAAVFGIILTATRVTGVFLPLVLVAELLIREQWRITNLLLAPDGRFRALAIMPLGGIAFLVYLGFHVGDPLANVHVQAVGWEHDANNPLAVLLGGILSGSLRPQLGVAAFFASTTALVAGLMLRRIPMPLGMMALIIGGTALSSGLAGLWRYALGVFPMYLIVPALPRRLQYPLLVLMAIGQCVLIYFWPQRVVDLL